MARLPRPLTKRVAKAHVRSIKSAIPDRPRHCSTVPRSREISFAKSVVVQMNPSKQKYASFILPLLFQASIGDHGLISRRMARIRS